MISDRRLNKRGWCCKR